MQNAKRVSGAGVTCLVLVLCGSYAQEEHYPSRASTVPGDFPVYYVAARMARHGRGQRLYFPFDRPYSVPMIVGGKVEPGTAWDRVARSSGLGPTLHFITPPFGCAAARTACAPAVAAGVPGVAAADGIDGMYEGSVETMPAS